MKKRTAWILAAGVAAVALGAAAVGAVALLVRGGSGRLLPGGSTYLQLRLQGELPEQPASELGSFIERRPPSLRTLIDSLDRAASDPAVSAAVLRIGPLSDAGWARVEELRAAVGRFRKSGKPAYAHIEFCGNKEYYLATASSKIYAVPTALLDVSGIVAEVTFLKGTLDKLGVEAQFEGVGRYKNAPNQFTERAFTEPHREQIEALVESLYADYVAAIAAGRNRTAEQVRRLVDAGPYDGRTALAAGLVDELLYEDQLEERLKGAARVTPGRYTRGSRPFFDTRSRLGLVYAVGDIVTGASQSGPLGDYAGSDTIAGALRQAREDSSLKAIVLRVDSPGGFGPAADVIWREVTQARKAKPVIVSMGDYAASGGYYIAMGATAIVAQPGTITGSIGVFSGKFSLRGLYDRLGLSQESVARGQNAEIYGSYRPWTEAERAHVRAMNVAFYGDFVARAAQGRGRAKEKIEEVAEGRVWTGSEALRHGLVDRLGGLRDALALAREKAGIDPGADVAVVVLPARRGLIETLFERQDDGGLEARLLPGARDGLRWARLLGFGAPLARLPFDVRVR